jgi:hypothetical protein
MSLMGPITSESLLASTIKGVKRRGNWGKVFAGRAALSAFVVALTSGPVAAQPVGNAVVAHYRAYAAALEAGDFATAEREAEAAFRSSQARDGRAGRTGVLALNLAMVRLRLNRHADAVAPARLAIDIARDPNSGIDPVMAELAHVRAEIGSVQEFRETANLERVAFDALERAAARSPALDGYAYDTALDLARLDLRIGRYRQVDRAVEYGLQFSGGAELPPPVARAHVLIIRGAARIYQGQERDAAAPIDEALQLLQPFAIETDEQPLTLGQSSYVQALLWRRFADAVVASRSRTLEQQDVSFQFTPHAGEAPLCMFSAISQGDVGLPEEELGNGAGAAILGLRVDADGIVVASEVLAVSSSAFRETLMRLQSWRLERLAESAPGCRTQTSRYLVGLSYAVAPWKHRWPELLSPAQLPL